MVSMPSLAGGYYNPTIDRYDPVSGIYYKSVESQTKSGFLSSGNQSIHFRPFFKYREVSVS